MEPIKSSGRAGSSHVRYQKTNQKSVIGSYWADNKTQARTYGYLWIGSDARNWNLQSYSEYNAHQPQWEPEYDFLRGPWIYRKGRSKKFQTHMTDSQTCSELPLIFSDFSIKVCVEKEEKFRFPY